MQHLHHHENPVDPNQHTRARISQMAAVGLPHHQIAFVINISVETLLKFYAQELESSAAAANLKVLHTLFELATSGKNPAVTMFWAKSRCGFQTSTPRPSKPPKFDPFDPDQPPAILKMLNQDTGEIFDHTFHPNGRRPEFP